MNTSPRSDRPSAESPAEAHALDYQRDHEVDGPAGAPHLDPLLTTDGQLTDEGLPSNQEDTEVMTRTDEESYETIRDMLTDALGPALTRMEAIYLGVFVAFVYSVFAWIILARYSPWIWYINLIVAAVVVALFWILTRRAARRFRDRLRNTEEPLVTTQGVIAWSIFIAVVGAGFNLFARLSPLTMIVDALIYGILLGTPTWICVRTYRRLKRDRALESWQAEAIVEEQWVPTRDVNRVLHVLIKVPADPLDPEQGEIREGIIHLITRHHWLDIMPHVTVTALVDLSLLAIAVFVPHPATAWLVIIGVPVSVIALWISTTDWLYSYIVLTNLQVVLVTAPPAWMIWMEVETHPLRLEELVTANGKTPKYQAFINRGVVNISTQLQPGEDKMFKLESMPSPQKVAKKINELIIARKRQIRAA